MRYCTHCGKQIDDDAFVCIYCGREVSHRESSENGDPRVKFCVHCGAELKEGADVCLSCGRKVVRDHREANVSDKKNNNFTTIAKVFMVLSCAIYAIAALILFLIAFLVKLDAPSYGQEAAAGTVCAIIVCVWAVCCLIPLAWSIPLTVHVFNSSKQNKPISTVTKVCILLLVNTVAGILLLCRTEQDRQE